MLCGAYDEKIFSDQPELRLIWNNFDAAGGDGTFTSFWNNAIAAVGGAWNSVPNGYASSHIISDTYDHVSICQAYCRP